MKSLLVHLRPIEEADLAKVRRWRNHPEVSRYMYTQHEVSQAEHLAWFQRSQEDPFRHLLMCEYGGESFGFVNTPLENPDAQRATWGFYLDPLSPRGRGQALGHAALVYAFEELKLHKLCGEALA